MTEQIHSWEQNTEKRKFCDQIKFYEPQTGIWLVFADFLKKESRQIVSI